MTERLSLRTSSPAMSRCRRVMLFVPIFSQVVVTRTESVKRTCPM